jgi:hypothetical protein
VFFNENKKRELKLKTIKNCPAELVSAGRFFLGSLVISAKVSR